VPSAKRISFLHIEYPVEAPYWVCRNDYSFRTHNPLFSLLVFSRFLRAIIAYKIDWRPGRSISKITDWTVAGIIFYVVPFTSLPNYWFYVLWVTLSRSIWCIWCIRWSNYGDVWPRQPSQYIRYSILRFCLPTGTPRWLAICIHPPNTKGNTEQSSSYGKSNY